MTIKIGVIGAGGRGKLAWHAHRPEDDVNIVAAADPREEILSEYRNRFGESCLVTRDYRELLEAELDAVFICSPDYLHEEHACAALERGLSVYLEKPMAITTEGCDRILETSRRHGATLFVGHNMRYMRLFRKMKQLIDQGCVGEVKSIWCRHFISYGGDAYFRDWHSERRFSNGLLLQKGVHDIDVIHWLAGGYSRNVSAFGNNAVYHRLPRRRPEERGCARFDRSHWPPMAQKGFSPVIDVEDQNVVIMELENGILATYMQCHFTPDACRNYTVIGTEGRLENYGDGPESPIMLWNQRTDSFRLIGDAVYRGDEPLTTGGHGGADPCIVDEFIRYIKGEVSQPAATPEAARMAVATGCAATLSLREKCGPVQVPPLKSGDDNR